MAKILKYTNKPKHKSKNDNICIYTAKKWHLFETNIKGLIFSFLIWHMCGICYGLYSTKQTSHQEGRHSHSEMNCDKISGQIK